jgi:hypothetical protein
VDVDEVYVGEFLQIVLANYSFDQTLKKYRVLNSKVSISIEPLVMLTVKLDIALLVTIVLVDNCSIFPLL